jgi:hypothetical protein
MADTDVAEMGTSTPLLTVQALPLGEEYNFNPQLIVPDVLVSVLSTADVSAGHRAVQVVEPRLQFESVDVL